MNNQIKKEGILDLGIVKIPCYVLENGTRVLSGRGMQNALKLVDEIEIGKQRPGTRLKRFLSNNSFKPFIYKDKKADHFEPIICYKGKTKINGYEATVLADICESVLDAKKQGIKLTSRQKTIADQCEILFRAFAKVGIIALVDEATGYQYEREQFELQQILKAYIAEELLPWQKKFPDVFYREIFRLNGWNYTVSDIKKRPGVVGTWTNKLIYEQLPRGVLDELKHKTPKNSTGKYIARLHQSLTEDIGNPHLQAQLNSIIALFQVSDNWKELIRNFNKMNVRRSGQLELQFKDLEYKEETKKIQNPTDFDKTLKAILSVPNN
ncbi:MAG: P63C domain-containing protein [Bacteroidota bacterium]|nr:P63C domain-containing protein [Bacteroidota bacterium]